MPPEDKKVPPEDSLERHRDAPVTIYGALCVDLWYGGTSICGAWSTMVFVAVICVCTSMRWRSVWCGAMMRMAVVEVGCCSDKHIFWGWFFLQPAESEFLGIRVVVHVGGWWGIVAMFGVLGWQCSATVNLSLSSPFSLPVCVLVLMVAKWLLEEFITDQRWLVLMVCGDL
ncbi:Hypothetical predicted protein [Olea europaea subsp. europaea]|uniref:Transmembrane protein n=1 Tax=Olea europaea subsp. europaea TaxID=158383 RepID=A0A8S0UIU1_OLEEU|nr:Hypothetical predicted protein [Olea europaea subsp. europaea]